MGLVWGVDVMGRMGLGCDPALGGHRPHRLDTPPHAQMLLATLENTQRPLEQTQAPWGQPSSPRHSLHRLGCLGGGQIPMHTALSNKTLSKYGLVIPWDFAKVKA